MSPKASNVQGRVKELNAVDMDCNYFMVSYSAVFLINYMYMYYCPEENNPSFWHKIKFCSTIKAAHIHFPLHNVLWYPPSVENIHQNTSGCIYFIFVLKWFFSQKKGSLKSISVSFIVPEATTRTCVFNVHQRDITIYIFCTVLHCFP